MSLCCLSHGVQVQDETGAGSSVSPPKDCEATPKDWRGYRSRRGLTMAHKARSHDESGVRRHWSSRWRNADGVMAIGVEAEAGSRRKAKALGPQHGGWTCGDTRRLWWFWLKTTIQPSGKSFVALGTKPPGDSAHGFHRNRG